MGPRATLIRTPEGFMLPMAFASTRPLVEGSSGHMTTAKSASCISRGSIVSLPTQASGGGATAGAGTVTAMTRMPKAAARSATALPRVPYPMMPTVWPLDCWWKGRRWQSFALWCHVQRRNSASILGSCTFQESIATSTYSEMATAALCTLHTAKRSGTSLRFTLSVPVIGICSRRPAGIFCSVASSSAIGLGGSETKATAVRKSSAVAALGDTIRQVVFT
mmetsp:Transcript_23216/g.65921  ORF Transcript_23216/g.65921 Transcript_23216/m.65921 type:complete len:221 (+) Transcript_23216:378-1040(+)